MASSGELSKLQVIAYSDDKFTSAVGSPYSVSINPEKYTIAYQTNYNSKQAIGSAGTNIKFDKTMPATVSFELVFDSTGAIPNSTDVSTDINNFKNVAYTYNGAIHSPNYLLLSWSTLAFKCRLTSLTINYTLFDPQGTPLRAKASVSFKGYIDPDTLAKTENNQSADLTHLYTVVSGDTLPLLCFRIYGDSRYYLDIAEKNGLNNFRALEPGMLIVFPPLK